MTKHLRSRLRTLIMLMPFVLVVGCGSPPQNAGAGTPSADDLTLLSRLGDLARQRVQQSAPAAVLEQVDIAPGEGRYQFRFVDTVPARTVVASGDVSAKTPDAFTLTAEAAAGTPAAPIELAMLKVGPDAAVAAAVRELSAASPRSLVLTRRDGRLVWRLVVNGPKGIVSGTVSDETGRFVRDASTP